MISAFEMTGATVLLLAAAIGSSAASPYYAQPLLDSIRHSLGLGPAAVGLTATVTQLGYAVGLMLAVPLGDLLERRRTADDRIRAVP